MFCSITPCGLIEASQVNKSQKVGRQSMKQSFTLQPKLLDKSHHRSLSCNWSRIRLPQVSSGSDKRSRYTKIFYGAISLDCNFNFEHAVPSRNTDGFWVSYGNKICRVLVRNNDRILNRREHIIRGSSALAPSSPPSGRGVPLEFFNEVVPPDSRNLYPISDQHIWFSISDLLKQ